MKKLKILLDPYSFLTPDMLRNTDFHIELNDKSLMENPQVREWLKIVEERVKEDIQEAEIVYDYGDPQEADQDAGHGE